MAGAASRGQGRAVAGGGAVSLAAGARSREKRGLAPVVMCAGSRARAVRGGQTGFMPDASHVEPLIENRKQMNMSKDPRP